MCWPSGFRKNIFAFWLMASSLVNAMTFEEFKAEVNKKDPNTRALQMQSEAMGLKKRKAEEITAIRIFSGATFADDTRHTSSPTFQGTRSTYANFGLGLKQQSSFGPAWSLSQNLSRTKVYGVSPLLLPQNVYYDFYPKFEVSVPLWKNLMGQETRAQSKVLEKVSELQSLSTMIDLQKKNIDVESTYYRYGIQKFLVDLTQKNLDRTQRLSRWVADRKSKKLSR